jgi:hypothetical protein
LTLADPWPELPLAAWRDTKETLHLWLQVAGKIRLAHAAPVNHWWDATLHLTARGLTTLAIPHGTDAFQLDFDLIDHVLRIQKSDGAIRTLALSPRPVAQFHGELMDAIGAIGLDTRILARPVEIPDAIPFPDDTLHRAYDPEYANRFWRVLLQSARVLQQFRARFLGKASPAHFFWGAMDLATTRFSGRSAPPHPGGAPGVADWVMREAYSHELSSAGWWPGGGGMEEPAYYAYAYPEPAGFREWPVRPDAAYYHPELREFVLPYDAVRRAADPDATLLAFLQDTYAAAAECGGWDRAALERAQP